jgi:transcriptional regulator with GAF, ATPase, and Fis domain
MSARHESIRSSATFLAVLRWAKVVAPSACANPLQGQTSTAKELFARTIHGQSVRRTRPLAMADCGTPRARAKMRLRLTSIWLPRPARRQEIG